MLKNGIGAGRLARALRRASVDAAIALIAAGLFLSLSASNRAAAGVPRGTAAVFAPNGQGSVYLGRAKDCAAFVCTLSWNAAGTEKLLALLEEAGAHITFAVTRRWAEENRETLERISSAGNEIALAAEGREYAETLNELECAAKLVESAAGTRPSLLILGDSPAERRAARSLSLIPVRGTIDLLCARGSAEELSSRARTSVRGGDIVLVSPTAAFAEAAADILGYYSSMGLTLTTVSGTIYD